jgi:transcriptional regulator with XRE-family HTH domain
MKTDTDLDIFARRLKEAMKLRRMSAAQLAKLTGIGQSTIFRYLGGSRTPIYGNLIAIASTLNVDLDFLAGRDGPEKANMLSELMEKLASDVRSSFGIGTARDAPTDPGSGKLLAHIPVLGKISQGATFRFNNDGHPLSEPLFGIPRLGDDDPDAFGVIVEGDSMTLRLLEGDVAVCSPRAEWDSGDLVLLRKNTGELTLKEISEKKAYFLLRSYNPSYYLEEIPKREVSFVHKLTSIRPGAGRHRETF